MKEFITDESSNIASVKYDGSEELLTVTFSGNSSYEYKEVSEEVFNELVTASSIGSYFASKVRGNFDCTKVEAVD